MKKISESEWKAIDLALCDSKFPHLKSIEFIEEFVEPRPNPHVLFRQALPKSYDRGILWYQYGLDGVYLIAIILPHSDLHRPMHAHRSSWCSAIPRITS